MTYEEAVGRWALRRSRDWKGTQCPTGELWEDVLDLDQTKAEFEYEEGFDYSEYTSEPAYVGASITIPYRDRPGGFAVTIPFDLYGTIDLPALLREILDEVPA